MMRDFATQTASDDFSHRRQAHAASLSSGNAQAGVGGRLIQRKADCACGGGCPRCAAQGAPALDEALRQTGSPLDKESRAFFEPRLGRTLGSVRVHTGAASNEAARGLRARAFTVGEDIFFAAGQFSTDRAEGRQLLAHELVHTTQQQGNGGADKRPATKLEVSQPGDAHEAEADRAAVAIMSGGRAPVISRTQGKLQRAPDDKTIDANKDVVGGFHPFDSAAFKFNAKRALKMDMAKLQEFLKVPMVMPRESYYFSKDKGKEGEKHAAKSVETEYPDATERAQHYTFFAGETWLDVIEPVTIATLDWQVAYNAENPAVKLQENAMLDDATLKAFKSKGFDPPGKSIDWKAKDKEEFRAIRAEEAGARKEVERGGSSAFATRQQIVSLAQSQVGKVFSSDRGDGKKHGWERIMRYYEVAYEGTMWNSAAKGKPPKLEPYFKANFGENTEDVIDKESGLPTAVKDTMAAGKFSFPNPGGPWSWCAIFAVWAIRAVTGKGRWDGKPYELEWVADPKLTNAKRGDLLYVKSDNQHHCILAEEPDPAHPDGPYETIEGNLEGQEVRHTKRWVSANLHGYYKAVKDDGSI
ncbi:MAG: DUF4157 domain-containing protein [Acidobacteria bacterium]|nr:DUF4157 domain-containing protein [Acidobacteriota bacterium]